jgi:hypothetical protein
VDYVVSVDRGGLSQPQPRLALAFDAAPEVALVVDGRVVPPSESGVRRFEIDVRHELTGPESAAVTLSRTLSYLVKRPGGESVRGELMLTAEVVPLLIEAPGESITTESASFMLAGSTEPDGTVSVEGRAITVDPAGRFAQLMSVSAVGDTTVEVRATAPGRAPRFVRLRVKRVASLEAEASAFERRAQGSYAAIADSSDDKRGWAVALPGRVTEVRSTGHRSSVLFDVTRGCVAAPCLVRLELGQRTDVRAGQSALACGYLEGKSRDETTGSEIPRVRVEFLRGSE